MARYRPFHVLVLAILPVAASPAQEPSKTASATAAPVQPASPWILRGRVVAKEDGSPLAGCTVTLTGHQATGYDLHWSWLDWRDPDPVSTDADGRWSFALPPQPGRGQSDGYPSRVHVRVKAPGRSGSFGMCYLSRFFAAPVQELADVRLPRASQLRVRLVDATGAPRPGLQATARQKQRTPNDGAWYWISPEDTAGPADAEGWLRWTDLQPGEHRIAVPNRTVVGSDLVAVDPASASEARLVVDTPHDLLAASGRVVDTRGQPVAGFLLYGCVRVGNSEEWFTARSKPDGAFRIEAVGLTGAASFLLKHPRNRRYDGWDEFGQHAWGAENLQVTLAPPATLVVHVRTHDGKVVDDLAVHAVPVSPVPGGDPVRVTRRFPDGVVRLELREGRYAVRAHARGTQHWPSAWIEHDVAANAGPLTVTLPEVHTRPVFVFSKAGRPIVDADVQLLVGDAKDLAGQAQPQGAFEELAYHRTMTSSHPTERQKSVLADRARTDRSGRVVLRCIAVEGPVSLRVRGGGAADSLLELTGWTAGSAPLEVAVGGGGRVVGTIDDATFVHRMDASSEKERRDADENGPGRDPWGKSRGDLLARHGPAVVLRTVGGEALEHVATLDLAGRFVIDGVPTGAYDVMLLTRTAGQKDGKLSPPLTRIDVVEGEIKTLSLTVPKGPADRAR